LKSTARISKIVGVKRGKKRSEEKARSPAV
jgi:hypothetical protein